MSLLAYLFEAITLTAVVLLWVLVLWMLRRRRDPDAALEAQADRDANRSEYPQ